VYYSLLKVKTSKYQKHKKQIQNSFSVPPPLLNKEDNCGPPVTKTYLDNSNGLHHSSNTYNKVRLFDYKECKCKFILYISFLFIFLFTMSKNILVVKIIIFCHVFE